MRFLLAINTADLLSSLTLMGQGMLGIFLVMALIALIVAGITRLSK